MSLVWITLFGILGVWSRALADHLLNKNFNELPIPTLIVNILGCFLIGIISTHPRISAPIRTGLIVGFCGGLTTFSSYILQIEKMSHKNIMMGIGYCILSIVLGFSALILSQKFKLG